MKNTHLTSVMIPHLDGCYLTATDIGCITTDGQPSIQWSITIQNGIGEVTTDSPLEEVAARAIHKIITGRDDLFDDLLADCRHMVQIGAEYDRTMPECDDDPYYRECMAADTGDDMSKADYLDLYSRMGMEGDY